MTLTRKEIENMPAGYEMNKLIAINVMGWALVNNHGVAGGKFWIGHGGSFGDMPEKYLPDFSNEIAPAFSVVDKICISAPEDCWTGPTMQINYKHEDCEVIFTNLDSIDLSPDTAEATAKTLPLAICRAALIAFMEQE